jgi:hypothetical protein
MNSLNEALTKPDFAVSHSQTLSISGVQLENGHPTTLRNLDGPDQYDLARSDAAMLVPDKISWIGVTVVGPLILHKLVNGPDIRFLENVWRAGSKLPP